MIAARRTLALLAGIGFAFGLSFVLMLPPNAAPALPSADGGTRAGSVEQDRATPAVAAPAAAESTAPQVDQVPARVATQSSPAAIPTIQLEDLRPSEPVEVVTEVRRLIEELDAKEHAAFERHGLGVIHERRTDPVLLRPIGVAQARLADLPSCEHLPVEPVGRVLARVSRLTEGVSRKRDLAAVLKFSLLAIPATAGFDTFSGGQAGLLPAPRPGSVPHRLLSVHPGTIRSSEISADAAQDLRDLARDWIQRELEVREELYTLLRELVDAGRPAADRRSIAAVYSAGAAIYVVRRGDLPELDQRVDHLHQREHELRAQLDEWLDR